MNKIIKTVGSLSAAIAIGACAGYFVKNDMSVSANAASNTPESIIGDYLTLVQNGDYDTIYANAQAASGQLNDKDEYAAKVQEVFGSVTNAQYKLVTESDDVTEYEIYVNDAVVANIKQVLTSSGSYATTATFPESTSYTIEVPTGMTLIVDGNTVDSSYKTATAVVQTNYSGLTDQSEAPLVDLYYVADCLGEPEVSLEGQNNITGIKDVTGDVIYVGWDVTADEDLANTIISYAKVCAGWPAGDNSGVAGISITSSDWYSRVSEVQNQWFTAHSTPTYSNEDVLKIVQTQDDAIIANVVFDYYATNGTVDRTWNCGYQMTLQNVAGTWKIAGMGIDSTLNPNAKTYD